MPVIQVFAPEARDVRSLLGRIADDVAGALGLGVGDVIVTFVPVTETAVSGGADTGACWPVVTVHGRPRAADASREALVAAENAVRAWGVDAGLTVLGVWAAWTPNPS